ncbi:hypothetical protein GBA63_09150 [Rubrobacter tropicus]|uniref:Uncharacterized protein n=1 Tax=Rubrobacter tropicus TaxID=2653851 RepID=A0A6G8Q8P7_9ACTN|nr:hypothetical protein [Rubrobacter tropicus]QIN82798.1 hypothetical protein GBA63_09150 [Rubrobacter tropicus]
MDLNERLSGIERGLALLADGASFDDPAEFEYLCRRDPDEPKILSGRYAARLTGLEDTDDLIAFYFEILCGEWAGTEVSGDVENDLSSETEGRSWVESLLGRPLEENERIDLDLGKLVGKRCEIRIGDFLGSPSVLEIYRASPGDPELEELLLQEKILHHDPFDSEAVQRQIEEDKRLFREVGGLLNRRLTQAERRSI